jgi:multidrug efflux pump subunit AcrB
MKMYKQHTEIPGVIAWFASNPVAANLLMLFIAVAGVISAFNIKKAIMPQFETNMIQVGVPYLGAAPEEVEEAVVLRIEEAVQDLNGIKQINSNAREGYAQVNLEVETGFDIDDILDQVQARVDGISTFPEQTERPIIRKLEFQVQVTWISVYGDTELNVLKEIAHELRDELMALPAVSAVDIVGDRDYEIAIEVSEDTLRKYGLTLGEVAAAVQVASLDMPGGAIKTAMGDILLRTEGQVYTGREFAGIALRSNLDGTRLLLGDIATIKDGFVETEGYSRFNGRRAVNLRVSATGDQSVLETDAAVKEYIAEKKPRLPAGVSVDHWGNTAYYLKDRMNMMLANMAQGAVLVFILLALFLRIRVAWWVIIGIPISFLGALWLMPHTPFPVDINIISLFGFILVLGIVVDDAIVIGESVCTEIAAKGHTLDNVIRGANRVAVPVTFGVLTTIAAFVPMLMVGGQVGPAFESIGMVVSLCLVFSLLESKLVLPAHMAGMKYVPDAELDKDPISRLQKTVNNGLQYFIDGIYQPFLLKSLNNRYTTVAVFVAGLAISIGLVAGNHVKFEFFPSVPSDFIQSNLAMNDGTSPEARNRALDAMEQAIKDVEAEYLRQHPDEQPFLKYVLVFANGDLNGGVVMELTKPEERSINANELEELWRERVGAVPGAREVRYYSSESAGGGSRINFQLSGTDYDQMDKAAHELEVKLREYDGVFDIRNSYNRGSEEIKLRIKPEAELLNLTMADLGRQVRQAFYGEEAQRIQRGRDDVRVMVRYPREERRSVTNLENLRIRTPGGGEVPFAEVAKVEFGSSYATINRVDRKRTVTVTADTDPEKIQSGQLIDDINNVFIPELLKKYPGISSSLQGSSQEQEELQRRIAILFGFALFLIYVLLAIPLHSYTQPFIIMSVIPFGFIGAMIGHVLFGKTLSMMSIFGLVALSGVIINDGIVLVDFVNSARQEGMSLFNAVIQGCRQRFRAVLLTTLTTFFGLFPIMFETSLQAQFVIPMALSLAFGILFGTVVTLLLIPALYMILADVLSVLGLQGSKRAVTILPGNRGS